MRFPPVVSSFVHLSPSESWYWHYCHSATEWWCFHAAGSVGTCFSIKFWLSRSWPSGWRGSSDSSLVTVNANPLTLAEWFSVDWWATIRVYKIKPTAAIFELAQTHTVLALAKLLPHVLQSWSRPWGGTWPPRSRLARLNHLDCSSLYWKLVNICMDDVPEGPLIVP